MNTTNNNQQHTTIKKDGVDIRTIVVVAIAGSIIASLVWFAASLRLNERVDQLKSRVVIEKPFEVTGLEARSAIVWDIRRNRTLYEHAADKVEPLASLTKLVTAAVALESVSEQTVVPITPYDIAAEGDSGFRPHERWKVRELLKTVLISSSNDGARAVANVVGATLSTSDDSQSQSFISNPNTQNTNEHAFVDEMNAFSKKIGLEHTYFKNEHGLDISPNEAGGYGSARDVAKLFAYVFKHYPHVLGGTTAPEFITFPENNIPHIFKNTNTVVNLIPGILASKTGFTDLAGGNVAVITSPGMEGPFAIVILGSSYDGRFSDLEKLSKATLEYLEKNR